MFVVDLNNACNNTMYGKTSNSSCTYSRFIVVDLSICAGQVIEPGSHKTVVQASFILESHIRCFNLLYSFEIFYCTCTTFPKKVEIEI